MIGPALLRKPIQYRSSLPILNSMHAQHQVGFSRALAPQLKRQGMLESAGAFVPGLN